MKGKKMGEDWNKRRSILNEEMYGFCNLLTVVQGMLIGYSLTTGEIWCTTSMSDTVYRARKILDEMNSMIEAFGMEQ